MLHPRVSIESAESGDKDLDLARTRVLELFVGALEAVEPARAVRDSLDWQGSRLVVGGQTIPDVKGHSSHRRRQSGGCDDARRPRGVERNHRLGGPDYQGGSRRCDAPSALFECMKLAILFRMIVE